VYSKLSPTDASHTNKNYLSHRARLDRIRG
jgi:hypothetical protein